MHNLCSHQWLIQFRLSLWITLWITYSTRASLTLTQSMDESGHPFHMENYS